MSLNQSFDGLRDKSFIQLEGSAINAISLNGQNQKIRFSKTGEQWFDATGMPIDSARMAQYLNGLSNLRGNTIVDGVQAEDLNLSVQVSYNAENASTTNVSIYERDSGYILQSSQNRDMFFESDSSGIYKNVLLDLVSLYPFFLLFFNFFAFFWSCAHSLF